MNINDFTDEFVEEVIKDIPRRAKAQIFGTSKNNVSDVTGKPIPKKHIVSKISREIDQLDAIKTKKLREEFDKMKLQSSQSKPLDEIKKSKKADNIVDKTLKNSLSTGENKGGAG